MRKDAAMSKAARPDACSALLSQCARGAVIGIGILTSVVQQLSVLRPPHAFGKSVTPPPDKRHDSDTAQRRNLNEAGGLFL